MTWSIIPTARSFLSMRVNAVSSSRMFVKVLPVKSLGETCQKAGKQENMCEKKGTWNILSKKLFRPTALFVNSDDMDQAVYLSVASVECEVSN